MLPFPVSHTSHSKVLDMQDMRVSLILSSALSAVCMCQVYKATSSVSMRHACLQWRTQASFVNPEAKWLYTATCARQTSGLQPFRFSLAKGRIFASAGLPVVPCTTFSFLLWTHCRQANAPCSVHEAQQTTRAADSHRGVCLPACR